MSGFIPEKESNFLTFARRFVGASEKYAETLGIPAAMTARLKTGLGVYEAAYETCGNPNAGKLDREDRKEKRAALTADIRKTKNAYIDADPQGVVTDEIRLDFGLPPRDAVWTPAPKPAQAAPFSLERSGYLRITVRHPAKPPGCKGAAAFYVLGGPDPVSHEALTGFKLLTRPVETLTFKDTDSGKTLHICLYWQNGRGELGPPSPIQSIVVM
jgi:hypothetical protein